MMLNKDTVQPFYQQIEDMIMEMIRKGELKKGDSLFSENELSLRLKVSRLTVRKAYQEMAKKGFLNTVQGKGTFVSKDEMNSQKGDRNTVSKVGSSTTSFNTKRTIGVMFPEIALFFPQILRAIEERAAEKGYIINIMFNDSIEKEKQAIEKLIENNVDGIILTPLRNQGNTSVENYELLHQQNIPVVMVGYPPFHFSCDAVYCDDVSGSYESVEHLVNKGHKRIIFFSDSRGDYEAVKERKEGYLKAINDLLGPSYAIIIDKNDTDWENAFFKLMNIEGEDAVSAIFMESDHYAPYIYSFIYSLGKSIPNDVAVIGYDNSDICENLPVRLASVEQPKKDMGYCAFRLLYEILEEGFVPRSYSKYMVVKSKLIPRESMGD